MQPLLKCISYLTEVQSHSVHNTLYYHGLASLFYPYYTNCACYTWLPGVL